MPERRPHPRELGRENHADLNRPYADAAALVVEVRRDALLQCADAAAEAVRALIHMAGAGAGALAGPAEVYAMLCVLARLGDRLPQVLDQLLDVVAAEYVAGTLQVVNGAHADAPAAVVTDLARQLSWAATSAHALSTALERGEVTLAWAATARRV
jgi:hypothetical protein